MRGHPVFRLIMVIVSWLAPGLAQNANTDELEQAESFGVIPAHISELFDSELLADNVYAVIEAAQSRPPEARYGTLKSHVLPCRVHSDFRLYGKFTPTNPPDSLVSEPGPSAQGHPDDSDHAAAKQRVRSGGRFVSPVYELLKTAHNLNRLADLASEVEACVVKGEIQERCRLSLMAMIAVAREDQALAAKLIDELYQRFLKERFSGFQDRMPETLLTYYLVDRGVLLDEACAFLVTIQDSQIRAGVNHGPTEWDVLMIHLNGRIRHWKLPPETRVISWSDDPRLKSWHWATRAHSWSHGLGLPSGHIQPAEDGVDVLAKMDDEFLLFTSPLRGNYSLECLCTGFGWKEIHPSINGTWMTPVYSHESVQFGELFRVDREPKISPKLSRVDDWIAYRVDVRDGTCSRYLNSRLISRDRLPPEHDPWVAIRNPNTGIGSVRNVRITGNPTVPDTVTLSELRSSAWRATDSSASASDASKSPVRNRRPITHLLNWNPWHEDPWTPDLLTWQLETVPSEPTQIVGRRKPEMSGTAAETMLRYLWPLVWNCEVSYEFFYEEGKSLVHPALGLRAFLLSPNGVNSHRVTNGKWDDSGLDPLNAVSSKNQPAMTQLPLKSGEWNRMTMHLNGDSLELRLNDMPVHVCTIPATNDRSFGLFHFCDQSEARVRNVILKGDWPKQVPAEGHQELSGRQTELLDRERLALNDSFEIDFTKADEREVLTRFLPAFSDPTSLVVDNKGLQMSGIAKPKKQSTSLVGPRVAITGDFDVIAEFSELTLKAPDNGSAAIYLGPRIPLPEHQACLLFRGIIQHPDTPLREITQVEVLQNGSKGFRWSYPAIYADECRSGRLRLARRGKILHYLIAPLDSAQFRVLHSMEMTDQRIEPGNFLVRVSCYSQGNETAEVKVCWKSLSIRATKLEPFVNTVKVPE